MIAQGANTDKINKFFKKKSGSRNNGDMSKFTFIATDRMSKKIINAQSFSEVSSVSEQKDQEVRESKMR